MPVSGGWVKSKGGTKQGKSYLHDVITLQELHFGGQVQLHECVRIFKRLIIQTQEHNGFLLGALLQPGLESENSICAC